MGPCSPPPRISAIPLTDPELDLLTEMLADDPAAEVFLQVGEELVRRTRWAEAQSVLARGLSEDPSPRGFELLARAAMENGDLDLATSALERVPVDPVRAPENARLWILVLERSGRIDEARLYAASFLSIDPGDVVVQAVVERLNAPPPASDARAHDPFYTVARAERYVRIGRIDRAIRAYRRILMRHPTHLGLELRLRQLSSESIHADDDLSEELTDPGLVPPEPIDMPVPRLNTASPAPPRATVPRVRFAEDTDEDETNTEVPVGPRVASTPAPTDRVEAHDEEDTDLDNQELRDAAQAMRPRRRRRSLIRR